MKAKYAVILTVLLIGFLFGVEVFISSTFHMYGIVLCLVFGYQLKRIYYYLKNGG